MLTLPFVAIYPSDRRFWLICSNLERRFTVMYSLLWWQFAAAVDAVLNLWVSTSKNLAESRASFPIPETHMVPLSLAISKNSNMNQHSIFTQSSSKAEWIIVYWSLKHDSYSTHFNFLMDWIYWIMNWVLNFLMNLYVTWPPEIRRQAWQLWVSLGMFRLTGRHGFLRCRVARCRRSAWAQHAAAHQYGYTWAWVNSNHQWVRHLKLNMLKNMLKMRPHN